jgi:hypothetical protein
MPMVFIAHVVAYPGSGVPIHVRFARKGESEYHCLKNALQFIFNYGESNNAIDLSRKLLIAANTKTTTSKLITKPTTTKPTTTKPITFKPTTTYNI